MASVRSLPFVIDTGIDSSGGHRRSKLPSFLHRSKKFLDSGFPKVVGGDIVGFSLRCRRPARGQHWRIKCLAAMSDGSAEVEDGEESDDALKDTIEKSKKVLAMQRDLIQQITERRKVISSIKGSVINEEDNVASDKLRGTSFSRPEIASSSDDGADEDFNTGSPSGSSFHSTADEHMKVQPSAISKDFDDAAKKLEKDSPPPNTLLDTDSSKDNKSGTVISDERPSFLSKSSSASSQNDKKNKDMKKSSLQMDGGLSTGILSNSNIHSTADEVPETRLSAISKGSAKESEKDTASPKTVLETGSDKQLKDSTSETVWSDGLPSFLSESSSTSGLKDEKQDESSLKMVDGGANIPISEDVKPPPLAGANVMNVILVAAECAPWSKTGGLGDVAGALPKALARRGHRVMVVAPRYGNYAEPQNTGVRKIYRIEGQDMEVTFFQAYIDGVDFVFIDSAVFRSIGNDIYGGKRVDILKRMVLFCKAAVEVPWQVPCGGACYGDGNLVFIANDWHTALLPVYLKAYYRDNGLMKYTRSILVIHNIAHQGRGPVDDFSFVDLPQHYLDLFRLYDPVGGEHFNIFAAGLKTADRVVTVSHGYAWELKTSEGGWGLHGIINEYDWKLKGIVNGIDAKEWNPQLDVHLKYDGYTNYSLETLHTGKAQCKAALQKELGLPIRDDVPLIGFIGRLDHQKGVDLIAEAVPWMMGQDVQLVMLGTGRTDLEQMLKQFESQHQDKIRGWVGFSVKTAHRITAGSDILLMPSRFEPCGLNQLYAMCYGTIPVVHAVGGLRDTVEPFNPYNESGLGWTFDRAEAGRLIYALGNCLLTYREYKKSWEGIQKRGMMQDLSWDNAAQNYEEVLVAAKYQW